MIQLRQLPRVQVQVQFQEKSWRTRTRLHSLEMHVLYRSVWWKNIGKPWKTSDQLASSGVFHGEMCRVSDPQTSQLGYAVTGGLWAAASLLSFMVSICTPLPFLYTSVQVWICHSYFCCVSTPTQKLSLSGEDWPRYAFWTCFLKFNCFGGHFFGTPQALSRNWVPPTLLSPLLGAFFKLTANSSELFRIVINLHQRHSHFSSQHLPCFGTVAVVAASSKFLQHVNNVASRASPNLPQPVINVASRASSSKLLKHVINVASRVFCKLLVASRASSEWLQHVINVASRTWS